MHVEVIGKTRGKQRMGQHGKTSRGAPRLTRRLVNDAPRATSAGQESGAQPAAAPPNWSTVVAPTTAPAPPTSPITTPPPPPSPSPVPQPPPPPPPAPQQAAEPEVATGSTGQLRRRYLSKGAGGESKGVGELDFTKLLSQQALLTWGQLLANLPGEQVQQLLRAAKKIEGERPEQAAEASVELAAVQAALHTHANSPAPENMFCPFTIVSRDEQGKLLKSADPTLHWGNVDTGSMVNIVYSGVLQTFPHLHQYLQKFEHVVKGVGDKLTKVTGKLVGVPISLGMEQGAGTCVKTTFYVLACDSYHFILGLALLSVIDGGVFCGSRRLEFTLGPAGGRERCSIPLAARSTARQSPCYAAVAEHLSRGSGGELAVQMATLAEGPPDGWKGAYLGGDTLPYVQEALVDVAAWAACNNDSTQYLDCLPSALTHPVLDCSTAQPPPSPPSPTDPPTPACTAGDSTAHVQEAQLAHAHLSCDYVLPAWQGELAVDQPLPRKVRKAASTSGAGAFFAEFATGVNSRGYGAPRRKGKPLSKALAHRELLSTSNTKVVVTGPDYVGVTTLLQLLGKQLGIATLAAPRPPPADRVDFSGSYFDELVARWRELSQRESALLIEESPWSYLAKHAGQMTTPQRDACHAQLAQLVLPHVTFVLHTSGVAVGRRHPHHRTSPEEYSQVALRQMASLQFLPQPCLYVDASVGPVHVAQRVTTLLNTKVFKVAEAAAPTHVEASAEVEGMQHLITPNPSHSQQECEQLAQQLLLHHYTTDKAGCARLARLANIITAHPTIVNPSISRTNQAHYYQAIHDHVGAFALDMGDIASPAHTPPFEIHTFGPPCHRPPIRLSPPHAKVMREQLSELVAHALVDTRPTPWASPAFLTPKPRSDKLRMVIDFRQLNQQTRRDSHPLPHTRDVILSIAGQAAYCKLDLMSGFWQMAVDPDSQPKTGVCTPEMLFFWLRLAFGLRNGPAAFQRAVWAWLHKMGLAEIVAAFIDDLATGGKDHKGSAHNFGKLLAMLEEANLKAGATKVFAGLEEMDFLGFTLAGGELKPDKAKVEAISRLQPPRTRSEVRSFLGLTGYYREFVHRYAHIARPLNNLLKEDTEWAWDASCSAAFSQLKSILTSSPILSVPDQHRPYVLHTDFSHTAVGAILEQLKEDNKHHVIAYASRTCSAAESKLGPTDGELLAIVYAVEKFHNYLAGTPFVVVTDHSALVHLNEAKTKNPKLARWAMRLAAYNFTLRHRAGRVHNNADGLSRSHATPAPDTPPADVTAIDSVELPADVAALEAALQALEEDPYLDGDAPTLFVEDTAPAPPLGPRQLLLESAPCHTCAQDLPTGSRTSVICDRCNQPHHLRCVGLSSPPPTYWYCTQCTSHHAATGLTCPTQDIALQRYLLDLPTPPALHPTLASAARHLCFTDQLYAWRAGKWVAYPPEGLQLLLMEEEHLRHCHVGGEKLYQLLAPRYYWPTMQHDCASYARRCFECQVAAGRSTGSWAGKLLPLPPGPRVTWACDLIESVSSPAGAAKGHILVMVDCFSKFCLLAHLPDKASSTVATTLQSRLFSVFGAPATLRCDNGTAFKGAVTALCAARGTRIATTSPYTSHSNGQVERFNRTVEDLLRRCLITLPESAWPTLLPDIQLALNTTYARSVGCPPYLIMFGTTPPTSALSSLPDPSISRLQQYASALRRQLRTIQAATHTAHERYAARSAAPSTHPPDTLALTPGRLAMVTRPRTHKLFSRNAGPFLVTRVASPHIFLQSLTSGATLKEHVKNVRPLHVAL